MSWRRWQSGAALAAMAVASGMSCHKDALEAECASAACELPLASVCSVNEECSSGVCAQGVCCDQACDGACMACNQLHAVGHCSAAPSVSEMAECDGGGICSSAGNCAAGMLWGLRLGATGPQQVSALASDGKRLLVAGSYALGLEGLGAAVDGKGAFVAELDGLGQLRWRQLWAGGFSPSALALAGDGSVWLAGQFTGAMMLGRELLTAEGLDGLVLRLDAGGALQSWRQLGGQGSQRIAQLALTQAGEALVVGGHDGPLDLGGELVGQPQGGDAFVAKLAADGEPIWAISFGSAGSDLARAVALSADDEAILVGGVYNGPLQLGGSSLTHAGGDDGFLARLDPNGAVRWARGYGGIGSDGVAALAVDPAGDLVVTGTFTKGIDFGGNPMVSLGCEDVFAAKLTLDGQPRWSVRFGDDKAQLAEQLAVDAQGRVFISGMMLGAVELGWGPAGADGGGDVMVAALTAQGEPLWLRAFGDGALQRPHGLALLGDGLVVGGYLEGSLSLNGQALQSAQGADGFVLALGL